MLLERFLSFTLGKKQFQWFYTRLYKLSLCGINASGGGDFRTSGELYIHRYIKRKFQCELLDGYQDNPAMKVKRLIFDVGANKGLYTKELSKHFPEAEIYSFEPSKDTYRFMKENTRNSLNVHSYNLGFSSEKAERNLYSDTEGSGLASIYHRELSYYNITMNCCELVELTTIDDFCKENDIERIDFLKTDMEEHELAVLQGARLMLGLGNINFIQFEFGGTCIDSRVFFRDYWSILHDKYKIYRVLKNGLAEIKRYTDCEEIFCTADFLAEKNKNA